jgi:FAD/FMN-containing dehydrogenase
MLKNNAGYDLKHLFIGTEGTLGVVSRVVLRLRPASRSQETALVACPDFMAVSRLLALLDAELGGTLTSFELLWQTYYELAAGSAGPLPGGSPYYVLVEALGSSADDDGERFAAVLNAALEGGLISDARVCKQGAERAALWALRDSVDKALAHGPGLIFDVSLRLSDMERYVRQVHENLDSELAGHMAWVFGHAADGNLHIVVVPDPRLPHTEGVPNAIRKIVERAVYEPLQVIGGSISGEHGIGMEKRLWLPISRSAEEIALMRTLKRALDPNGILNPGRVIPVDDA